MGEKIPDQKAFGHFFSHVFWQDEEWEEGDGEWEYEARVSYGHSGRLDAMCWEIGYPNHSLTNMTGSSIQNPSLGSLNDFLIFEANDGTIILLASNDSNYSSTWLYVVHVTLN